MTNPLEDQADELEVLKSIFDGDENFSVITNTSFQYKFGPHDDLKSFLLGIEWPTDYPQTAPTINLELFYNKRLLPVVKSYIHSKLLAESEANMGMAMTYTLIEFVKENLDDLLKNQVEVLHEQADDSSHSMDEDEESGRKQPKDSSKSQMTKSQKRRMWDRVEQGTCGERERGWDWVDIIKHLCQGGPQSSAPS